MISVKILPLFFSFVFHQLPAQDQIQYYVSPHGKSTADGTSAATPFASLETAQQAIRRLKQAGELTKPVVVNMLGGTYNLEKPVVFTEEDGGAEDTPITYQAYQEGEVIISGGKTITGWKPFKNGLWMTRLPKVNKGQWQFRQLYVNGTLRQRARTPNQGFLRVKGFPDGGPEVHYHTDCQRFEFAEGGLNPQWTNLTDVEVIVYHFWTDSHLPIQSIDAKSRIVTFQHKAGKVFTNDFTKEGARYVVENLWEALDAPGEWYLNKKTGILYYYPMPGEDLIKVEVVAPVAPELLRLEGKPTERKPVTYLNFKGLIFQYAHFELPAGNSNDKQGSASVPAAITLKGAQNCIFERCRVRNLGTFAFDILDGSQHNQIKHCDLSYLGAGGIRLNGGTEKDHPLLRTAYNQVIDNILHHYGEIFPSAVGMLLMNAGNNEIAHNEIHHGWYTGISVGWVWGYRRSTSIHNTIAYNHIHDIGQTGLLSDMGGIYTLGVSPGTVIRNNIIHDINANHYGGWGMYHDEGSTHLLVENNIVYNTKFAPFNIHFSKEVTVRNNIFALGKLEQLSRGRVEPHKSVFFENNIIYWREGELLSKKWQDQPYKFHLSALREPQEITSTFDMDYNLYFNPTATLEQVKFNGQSWSEWQQRGKDVHSLYTDPMFVDAGGFDFRLRPESPAFKLGFQPIDVSKVGVRK
ncbi:MAG: right-handed parallel beta-helix repeat-containing protein [Chitinophagaceae bacterium]